MSVCAGCGKDNKGHYKFCLGCGAEIGAAPGAADADPTIKERAVGTPAARSNTALKPPRALSDTNPDGGPPTDSEMAAVGAKDAALAPSLAAAAAASRPASARACGQCGAVVPTGFQFCGQCGTPLVAPEPKSQKTMALNPLPAPAAVNRGRLVLIRPDGTEGGSHPLTEGENQIGRGQGTLFDADGYLSPRHAELVMNAAGIVVRDLGSLNGVFIKLTDEEELVDGDVFRIGQELLQFDEIRAPEPLDDGTQLMGSPNPGYWGRLALVVAKDQEGSAFPLLGDTVILGRERGDILFPEDGYVSGAHARIVTRGGRFYLSDLNSSNGTFRRIEGDRQLTVGSFILMGQQLFRVTVP